VVPLVLGRHALLIECPPGSKELIPSRVQLTLNAKAPKFLKNRETLIFQKLAGGDCSPPYQLAIKHNAVCLQVGIRWRQTVAILCFPRLINVAEGR
jgi:hypothetical protein